MWAGARPRPLPTRLASLLVLPIADLKDTRIGFIVDMCILSFPHVLDFWNIKIYSVVKPYTSCQSIPATDKQVLSEKASLSTYICLTLVLCPVLHMWLIEISSRRTDKLREREKDLMLAK